MTIRAELIEILACPRCKGPVHLERTGRGLICEACRVMYPIQEEIPIMLLDEAVKL